LLQSLCASLCFGSGKSVVAQLGAQRLECALLTFDAVWRQRRAELLGLSAFDVSIADLAQFSIAVAVAVQMGPSHHTTSKDL